MAAFVIRFQDDETFAQAGDVLDGLEFVATLQIRTPLVILNHHGETHPGPPSAAPKYGTIADGFWSYKTKSWDALAGRPLSLPKQQEGDCASDIGPVKPSEYLPFLKAFREVVESDLCVDKRLSILRGLENQSEGFRSIWSRLKQVYPDFPESFFFLQLTAVPGLGSTLAKRLFESGIQDIKALTTTNERELRCIRGVGPTLLRQIGEYKLSGRDERNNDPAAD